MSNPIETDQSRICGNCGKPIRSFNETSDAKVVPISVDNVKELDTMISQSKRRRKTSMGSKASGPTSKPPSKNTQKDTSNFCQCDLPESLRKKSGERPFTGRPPVEEKDPKVTTHTLPSLLKDCESESEKDHDKELVDRRIPLLLPHVQHVKPVKILSDSSVIRYSDGSAQMEIGDNYYDITEKQVEDYSMFLHVQQNILQAQGTGRKKMRFTQSSGINPERQKEKKDEIGQSSGAENRFLNKFSTIRLYVPARDAIWRGEFSITRDGRLVSLGTIYKAHFPYNMADSKTIEFSRNMGDVLQATTLPRLSLQDDMFPKGFPRPNAPYIYFLPERLPGIESIDLLMVVMNDSDEILKFSSNVLDSVDKELLVLTSAQLRKGLLDQSSCKETEDFFWGIFCPRLKLQ